MFSTERRQTKGKWDIHLPDKKNKINNNYKCTVGIHVKADELTKQKFNKKKNNNNNNNKKTKQTEQKTSKPKRNKETKQQHGANLSPVIQWNRPIPVAFFQSHGDMLEDIFYSITPSPNGGGGVNKGIKDQTFKIYTKPIKTADDVHTWLDG